MWTRKELKEQAKAALKRNYWKAVLVTTLVMALVGGTGGAAGSGVTLIGSSAEGGNSLWTYGFNYLHDYLPALLTVILIISVVAVLVALAVIILLVNPIEVGFAAFLFPMEISLGSLDKEIGEFCESTESGVSVLITLPRNEFVVPATQDNVILCGSGTSHSGVGVGVVTHSGVGVVVGFHNVFVFACFYYIILTFGRILSKNFHFFCFFSSTAHFQPCSIILYR